MSPTRTARRWLSEVGLGARLALGGGREGLLRTALTAVGVALGVTVLLLSVSVPNILDGRHARTDARDDLHLGDPPPKTDTTVLSLAVQSSYHDRAVQGRFVRAEGRHPVLPPGVDTLPPAGTILVSPALRDLFASPEGALLRQRFPQPIAGTIGKPGLAGPNELYFYGTRTDLEQGQPQVTRLAFYGSQSNDDPLDAFLLLLVVVIFVVLLMPVAMFVAAATRFGGEQRDRRLAAVRLVGADAGMTRRIAAGEAVVSAALGVLIGAAFFMVGRLFVERFELSGLSVYATDMRPTPLLAALIALAVPLAALVMTLLALRRVVVEPLGVVRRAVSRTRRRVWWRLLLPLVGLALLVPLGGTKPQEQLNVWQAVAGVVLLLIGVSTLLPWLFDRIVWRLGRGGGVGWQLAVRRLQLSSDSGLRAVNAIAIAAAGTIALQMLFSASQAAYTGPSRQDVTRAQAVVYVTLSPLTGARSAADVQAALRKSPGVSETRSYRSAAGQIDDGPAGFEVVVGDCAVLRLLADLPGCADGDVFSVGDPGGDNPTLAGMTISVGDNVHTPWTVPAQVRTAGQRLDPEGVDHIGLLVTPSAAPPPAGNTRVYSFVEFAPGAREPAEHLRNAAMAIGPTTDVSVLRARTTDSTFVSIRRGLYAGATVVLALVGLSLLVTTLEQLRERRRTLAALVAFGTRRSTVGLSILWQTALPVLLGLLVAAVLGLGLGAVLLRIVSVRVRLDWASVAAVSGIAAGVVLVVTLASLPALFRLMRPDGLRFE